MSYFLGVDTCSGIAIIPKELDWTENRNSVAIDSGLLRRYPYIETVVKKEDFASLALEMLGYSTK